MKKVYFFALIGVFFIGLASAHTEAAENADPVNVGSSTIQIAGNKAVRSIVQVKTYILDSSFNLALYSTGSGVIIDSDGTILTNNHVINKEDSFDGKYVEAAYQICLTNDPIEESDCSYSADFIRYEKDLDLALLRIKGISGVSPGSNYLSIEFNAVDTVNANDEVLALGYPAIGGDTITMSKGIISGKTEKYGKKWIKTDAVVSFGSSGGAAIDVNGKIIGITSATHSDFAGSLGYIINSASIVPWLDKWKNGVVHPSKLQARVEDMTKKQKEIKNNNIFENKKPFYQITKPSDWDFDYTSENSLSIGKNSDDDGGYVSVEYTKNPMEMSFPQVIKQMEAGYRGISILTNTEFVEKKNISINNYKGMYTSTQSGSDYMNVYLFLVRNYLISITYDYGKDEKDAETVKKIINSIIIKNTIPAEKPIKSFENSVPGFYIKAGSDWVIDKNNSTINPLNIANSKYPESIVTIKIEKTDENTAKLSNEKYLSNLKKEADNNNKLTKSFGLTEEIKSSKAKFKLGKVNNVFYVEKETKNTNKNETVMFSREYYYKLGDKYIQIQANFLNKDKKGFDNMIKDFEKNVEFGLGAVPNKIDSDKDGLSDADEKIYKTDPKKKDTDGDGFSDWTEINKGFNPLGPGKLKK